VTSDNLDGRTYREAMERGQPYIRLKLDTSEPIEMGAFVGAFTSIAAEYDRTVRERDDLPSDATLFVRDVRDGCIEADLIPWVMGALAVGGGAIGLAAAANTLHEFVERYGSRISKYLTPGGRAEDATKSELKHFSEQVAAIANTHGAKLEIAAIEVIDGEKQTRAAFKFDTSQAREIEKQVAEHQRELDRSTNADHERVIMTFTRSDIRMSASGKRSGELVRISAISERSLPLVYASKIAEQEIKHEISEAEDNVYKKGFVVDVNVELRGDKPLAYRITNLHQVIDLPDED